MADVQFEELIAGLGARGISTNFSLSFFPTNEEAPEDRGGAAEEEPGGERMATLEVRPPNELELGFLILAGVDFLRDRLGSPAPLDTPTSMDLGRRRVQAIRTELYEKFSVIRDEVMRSIQEDRDGEERSPGQPHQMAAGEPMRENWSAGNLEAAIALLVQGAASGELRGEELQGVIENSPPLARTLLRGLSQMENFRMDRLAGFGDLRRWSEESRLRLPVIVKALVLAHVERDTGS